MTEWEDRAEIEYLHTIFAFAADRGDYALLRSLYTDDAVDDHGGYHGPVDGYVAWVEQTHEHFEILSHIYGKPLIFIDGNTAESEIKGHVFMRHKGPPARNHFAVCRNFDKYRRTAEGWRFTSRAMCFDWDGPEFETPNEAPTARFKGTMDRTDPVYSELPGLAASMEKFASRFRS